MLGLQDETYIMTLTSLTWPGMLASDNVLVLGLPSGPTLSFSLPLFCTGAHSWVNRSTVEGSPVGGAWDQVFVAVDLASGMPGVSPE